MIYALLVCAAVALYCFQDKQSVESRQRAWKTLGFLSIATAVLLFTHALMQSYPPQVSYRDGYRVVDYTRGEMAQFGAFVLNAITAGAGWGCVYYGKNLKAAQK